MRKFLTIIISVMTLFCLSGCSANNSPVSGSSGETDISSSISEQNGSSGNSQTNSNASASSENKPESAAPSAENSSSVQNNNNSNSPANSNTSKSSENKTESTVANTENSSPIQSNGSGDNSQPNSNTSSSSEINSESSESGSEPETGNNDPQTSSSVNTSSEPITPDTESESKILVAFFSRADENYGVGYIEKGNTHIIADMIAEELNADTFEIVRVTPYPAAYRDCIDEAQREKSANARPELTATVGSFDSYDVIFLGYPNWWGDMPMPVYTFLESYDFSGKTVIPFCTHAGSGLSGTVGTLRGKLSGATVLDGLAIPGTTAQNDQDKAKQDVLSWLGEIDF